jgi:uncharacterized protein
MDLALRITPDRLAAILDLPAGQRVELAAMKELLGKSGVINGLIKEALMVATEPAAADRSLVLAEGEPPFPGFGGGLDPPLDRASLPRTVKAGEELGYYLPPEPAQPGLGVDGQPIPVADGPFTILGRGLGQSAEDMVVATRNGRLEFDAAGVLQVALLNVDERAVWDLPVVVDARGMEARVTLPAGAYLTRPNLDALLAKTGIVFGLVGDVLTALTEAREMDRTVVVARGQEPSDGTDAVLEHFIDEQVFFQADDYDRIDFHDLGKAREVQPGTPLARRCPATPGTPGITVRGQEHPARPGRNLNLDAIMGEGTRISATDPTVVEAAVAGIYQRSRNGRLQVLSLLTIDGDVDFKNGNIDTSQPVLIRGDIKEGFTVKSASDIQVLGVIEDARVSAQGNLVVRGGILPGRHRVKAHGDIVARYITGREVKGHHFRVVTSIRSCQLLASGDVSAREIMAGHLTVAGNVTCEMLGSSDEQRTVIEVGLDPYAQALYELAKQEQGKVAESVALLKERCRLLAHRITEQEAKPDTQELLADDLKLALQDYASVCTRQAQCEAIIKRHEEMSSADHDRMMRSTVVVRGTAHAQVEIAIGEMARHVLRKEIQRPTFFYKDGSVAW